LDIGRHLRQAPQERKKAQEALARLQERPPSEHDDPEAKALVEARQAQGQQWDEVQRPYRLYLETRSRILPPCRIADATPQTSDQVASRLHADVEAIAA
jgi:hypothetical protein